MSTVNCGIMTSLGKSFHPMLCKWEAANAQGMAGAYPMTEKGLLSGCFSSPGANQLL